MLRSIYYKWNFDYYTIIVKELKHGNFFFKRTIEIHTAKQPRTKKKKKQSMVN